MARRVRGGRGPRVARAADRSAAAAREAPHGLRRQGPPVPGRRVEYDAEAVAKHLSSDEARGHLAAIRETVRGDGAVHGGRAGAGAARPRDGARREGRRADPSRRAWPSPAAPKARASSRCWSSSAAIGCSPASTGRSSSSHRADAATTPGPRNHLVPAAWNSGIFGSRTMEMCVEVRRGFRAGLQYSRRRETVCASRPDPGEAR